ncbi:MAG: type I glyceraldehyde-3-phosphate dehydrogenase [Thermoanaerobaculia bacterium]
MPLPFAINGLGRIGRALLRVAREREGLELVAVNDLGTPAQLAPLIARDTLHGRFSGTVEAVDDALLLDGRRIPASQEEQASELDWGGAEPEVVIDATGHCKTRELAAEHLRGGVGRVLVSANARGLDLTICMGVNHAAYDPVRHRLLSAASCTTNALVPLLWVLEREFGVEHALLNTVHSYNNDQRLLSFPHPDPRRAREAAVNMIPTTTSAVEAAILILPRLEGRLDGLAVRVPTANVSLIDLVAALRGQPSVDELHHAFRRAETGDLAGILGTSDEPLVSSDYMSDPRSAVVDLPLTQQVDRRLYRVVAWYDNEWGHASRLADVLEWIHRGHDA